nr:unnamed protein product [Digitaria exilis]
MAAPAPAAGSETPKQLLSIIRDFASEKSHGERRVCDLKRRLADARAEADAAAAELEAAKRAREAAEQELRGSQVQAAIAAKTIQALEATISRLQEEISKVASNLDELKVRQELADVQAKRVLMEAVMGEMKQLQELGGYPEYLSLTWNTRTAELEKVHASLADELQRRYTCSGCGINNMPELEAAN